MKKLTLLLTALLLITATSAYAQKANEAYVSVNGLVCDFCARALEKTFGTKSEVKSIDVNFDTKILTVSFNGDQTLDDETLTKLVTDAGYNVEKINRGE